MRLILFLSGIFSLVGCFSDKEDLALFVETVKKQQVPNIPKLKDTPEFQHFSYQAQSLRNPFILPSRDVTEDIINTNKDCLQPNFQRDKSQLETYALDSLSMRGSLIDGLSIWALIQATDANIYRVSVGDYLGLYHGEIVDVSPHDIEIIELLPDGSGCWTERTSRMELTKGIKR